MNEQEAPVVVVVPGDLHLTEPNLDNHKAARRVVAEVNRRIQPDFVQFIGDNVQDATPEQFRLFDAIRRALDVPHFAIVGDHDVKGDPEAEGFRNGLGKTYGAISIRGFRFLRLNTQEAKPLGISAEQVDWFRDEVDRAIENKEKIVIFQHNYPFQIWEDFAGPGVDAWRGVVQSRGVEAIVCGHTHYWQVANDGRNVSIAVRSIGDPEGGPPGYAIVYLRGEDLAVVYRSLDTPGPIAMVTHPRDRLLATAPRHVVRGADRVDVRAWPWPGVSAVRARIDGGPWMGLESQGDGHWSCPLAGDRLAKGEHTLDVVATDRDNVEATQSVSFMVDPTGRYTAVPETRPTVRATAFC